MSDGVLITAMICGTIILVSIIGTFSKRGARK